MGSLAEFPDLVRETFVNTEINNEGIYNVRFYIRGKPWIVSVDDFMFFTTADGQPSLLYTFQSKNSESIWGAVLEKAWAKVKGNYINSEWGFMNNGLRALTGYPVFIYNVATKMNPERIEELW